MKGLQKAAYFYLVAPLIAFRHADVDLLLQLRVQEGLLYVQQEQVEAVRRRHRQEGAQGFLERHGQPYFSAVDELGLVVASDHKTPLMPVHLSGIPSLRSQSISVAETFLSAERSVVSHVLFAQSASTSRLTASSNTSQSCSVRAWQKNRIFSGDWAAFADIAQAAAAVSRRAGVYWNSRARWQDVREGTVSGFAVAGAPVLSASVSGIPELSVLGLTSSVSCSPPAASAVESMPALVAFLRERRCAAATASAIVARPREGPTGVGARSTVPTGESRSAGNRESCGAAGSAIVSEGAGAPEGSPSSKKTCLHTISFLTNGCGTWVG